MVVHRVVKDVFAQWGVHDNPVEKYRREEGIAEFEGLTNLGYQFPDWGWDMWKSEEFAILVFEVTKWKETLR